MGWGPSLCDPNYGTNILLDSESKLESWKNLLNTWSSSLGKKVEFFEKLINRVNYLNIRQQVNLTFLYKK
jgi:hypothetical protein